MPPGQEVDQMEVVKCTLKERNYRTNAELEKVWFEFLQINPSFL